MLTRRQLLKTSIAGGIILVLARIAFPPFKAGSPTPEEREYTFRFLTEDDRAVVLAVSPVMLALDMSDNREEILKEIVRGVDMAIAGLLPSVQNEIRDLFNILNFSFTRSLLCGIWNPWFSASEEEIDHFLSSWQKSRFLLLRSGYQALHELIMASWYGNPASWDGIGYEGPPDIGSIS